MKKILSILAIVAVAMMAFSCKNEGKGAQEGEETVVEAAEGAEAPAAKKGLFKGLKKNAEKAAEEVQEEVQKLDLDAINAVVPEAAALVEVKPAFNGGDANDFLKFVEENIVYPDKAKENGDHGKVYLNFVVDANGKVSNVKVLKGVSEEIDAEAVRVVESSPLWTPAQNSGVNVPVSYTMPISFELR